MLQWLGQTDLQTAERAKAYGWLPDVDRTDTSPEGVCSTAVEEAFEEEIDGKHLLLTEGGNLTPKKQSIAIPGEVFDVWPASQAAAILDEAGRPALCQQIAWADRKKLLRWGIVEEFGKQKLLETLQVKHLPKPRSWRHLLNLWAYIAPEITGYQSSVNAEEVRIVPVQGKEVLCASSETVRLGEKKLLQSDRDWEFLARHLNVLNQNWPRFLTEQRRTTSEHKDEALVKTLHAAKAVLEKIGLDSTSNVDSVINTVASDFFSQDSINHQECVQLAQVAAKLRAKVNETFKYVASDGKLRSIKSGFLYDEDGRLEELLPEDQRGAKLLHQDYSKDFASCSQEDWLQWISSGRAGLLTFVPFESSAPFLRRRRALDRDLERRGFTGSLEHCYKNPRFYVYDWDFNHVYWKHWKSLAVENPAIWSVIAERILLEKETYWSCKASAQIVEEASNGHRRTIKRAGVTPSWALKLRDLPCLPDTHGIHRKPGELLRRTRETESLMDAEPFVHLRLDRETTRPLLDLIGVRSTPTGPDRLLDYLRALAKAGAPPVHEVEKWYRHLDKIVDTCSAEDFQKIRHAFQSEKLILTQNAVWQTKSAVFLASNEEDVPDAEVIPIAVKDLTLWRKIGVADRPTADLAIEWLRCLPANEALEQVEARRVRSLLTLYPIRIWEECGYWLNLAGEWVSVDGLSYSLTLQSLIPWQHLHQWTKQKTADLRRLPAEITNNPPFSQLPTLAAHVEERFHQNPQLAGGAFTKEWLTVLGQELRRVELDTEDNTQRIRGLAERLTRTKWCETPDLEITPYIDGTPAGTPRRPDVLWLDDALYVDHLPKAKLARRVPEEVAKAFGRVDIRAALDYSFERSAQDVRDYLEENFNLCPAITAAEKAGEEAEPHTTDDPDEPDPTADSGVDQEPGDTESSDLKGVVQPEEDEAQDTDATEPEADIVVRRHSRPGALHPSQPNPVSSSVTSDHKGFSRTARTGSSTRMEAGSLEQTVFVSHGSVGPPTVNSCDTTGPRTTAWSVNPCNWKRTFGV